jgi:hypothetical protein
LSRRIVDLPKFFPILIAILSFSFLFGHSYGIDTDSGVILLFIPLFLSLVIGAFTYLLMINFKAAPKSTEQGAAANP